MKVPCGPSRATRFGACVAAVVLMGVGACSAQATLVLQPGSSVATLAGNGVDGVTKPGTAVSSPMGSPGAIAYDASGNLYIADTRNHQVTRISTTGLLTVVAGTGRQGFTGDGAPAITAELNAPSGVAVDASGNVFIADTGNQRVRRIAAADGRMSTVAGSGLAGFSGEGGPATAARLRAPSALALDTAEGLYIADLGNHRVRRLNTDGTLTTVAGSGQEGDDGDGGLALLASLESPSGLVIMPDGRLLIADRQAGRMRVVNADGTISAYAANTLALRRPAGLAADASGSIYVADPGTQQVVQSSSDGGSTLAGSGVQGSLAAGGPLATPLDGPSAVAFRSNGELAIGDRHNHQVQRITLASLAFGSVPAGRSSTAQSLTLQNGGASALQVLAMELPPSFATEGDGTTCATAPFTLDRGATCTVAIRFAPAIQGSLDGTARVRVNGAAPQSLLLTGTGTAGSDLASSITALHSDGSISYAGSPVTLSATVAGSLLNTPIGNVSFRDGTGSLASVALTAAGAATLSTASLGTGQHTLQAVYSGDAVYSTSTSTAVTVTVVPSPDFTMTATAASYSGKAGGTVAIAMTLVPVSGTLNHVVQFSVSGLPPGATAAFSPALLTLGGDAVPVTLTLQMPVTLASGTGPPLRTYASVMCVLIAGMVLYRRRRLSASLMMAALALGVSGCGSGFLAGKTAADLTGTHNYTAVVTATTTGVLGATLAHSSSIGLVITQ